MRLRDRADLYLLVGEWEEDPDVRPPTHEVPTAIADDFALEKGVELCE